MSTIDVQSASGAVYHIDYTDSDTVGTLKHRVRQRDWDAWACEDKIAMSNVSTPTHSNSQTPSHRQQHTVQRQFSVPDTKLAAGQHNKSHDTTSYETKPDGMSDMTDIDVDAAYNKQMESDSEFDALLADNNERLSNSTKLSTLNNKKLYYKLKHYPAYASLLNAKLRHHGYTHWSISLLADAVICVVGALFTAAMAQAAFNLPSAWSVYLNLTNAVPVTFQTFAVVFVGTLLGSVRGFMSMGIYACMIAAGAPFAAQHTGGTHVMIGASAGYIYGYLLAGAQVGYCAERGWDRQWKWTILSMITGNFIIYVCGLIFLPFGIGITSHISAHDAVCGYGRGCVGNTLMFGMVPFLPGDAIKIILAWMCLPIGWKLLGHKASQAKIDSHNEQYVEQRDAYTSSDIDAREQV